MTDSKSGKFAVASLKAKENKTCVIEAGNGCWFKQRQIERTMKVGFRENNRQTKGGLYRGPEIWPASAKGSNRAQETHGPLSTYSPKLVKLMVLFTFFRAKTEKRESRLD